MLDHGAKADEEDVKTAVRVGIPSLVAMLLAAGAPAPPGVPRSLASKARLTQAHAGAAGLTPHHPLFAARAFLVDAITHNNPRALDAAVRTGAHDLGVALAVCACLGTVEQMRILLTAGADCNARLRAPASIFDGATPMHCAAACGLHPRDEFVMLLADAGADIDATLPCGLTPLDVARHHSVRATLRSLGARHAHEEVRSSPEVSTFRAALEGVEALRTKEIASFKQSVAGGVHPDQTDLAGETALHALVRAKHASPALVFWLVQAGADVNHRSFDDTTPLHRAILAGDETLVEVLLTCGADPKAHDWLGFCPARLAAYERQIDCLRAITEHVVVKRRAEAAQGTEPSRPRVARRGLPPNRRRRAPVETVALTKEELERRAAAADKAANDLLLEEAALEGEFCQRGTRA